MKKIINTYTASYKGLSASAWWLAVVMLVNRMGTMVLPFMTLYLTESKGVSIGKAGLVITIFGAGTILGAYVGGKLTDKVGFYFIQLFALIGGGTLFIVLGQMEDYTSICIVAFFLSAVNESFRPANAAAVAHYSGTKNRTRSFTLNRLAINLGWAVGGAVGGFVAARSYHLLFWIDGLTNLGAALMLWLLLAPSRAKHQEQQNEKEEEKEGISAYKDFPYLVFIFMNIIFACCFLQIFTTIPVYFKQDLLLSEDKIGIIMAINGLIIVLIEMFIIHQLEGKRSLMSYIMIGAFLVGLGFLALNLLPGMFSLALIFIIIITLGEIIQMPFAATYWVNRSNSKNRGQYAALFTMSWAVAQIVAPGSAAWFAQYYGFNTLWWVVGFLCIATLIGYRWIRVNSPLEEMK
ncbi:MAG: MFS transporter [Chitinophagales bacterium]|nr:MFS transporter [Chitinophagaceae bacterium]MCB9064415.1 MFS transporter [Chitinophagales bacterium]